MCSLFDEFVFIQKIPEQFFFFSAPKAGYARHVGDFVNKWPLAWRRGNPNDFTMKNMKKNSDGSQNPLSLHAFHDLHGNIPPQADARGILFFIAVSYG